LDIKRSSKAHTLHRKVSAVHSSKCARGTLVAAGERSKETDMPRQNKIARLQTPPTAKARGRTAKTIVYDPEITGQGALNVAKRTGANRPTGKSSTRGGKNRGDRRDMSKTYSDTTQHAARGNTPRADVKTRKR
jgi:hypothetical protein